jgi:hypothetical protein
MVKMTLSGSCDFENYLAGFFERYLAHRLPQPARGAPDVSVKRSLSGHARNVRQG